MKVNPTMRRFLHAVPLLALFISSWAVPPANAIPIRLPVRLPCDALDPAHCLLPFPNDRFTVPAAGTATGRRVNFLPIEMPRARGSAARTTLATTSPTSAATRRRTRRCS
ncbi:MAG: hypothetical protein LC722_07670 [Actinobacteria bacterium]|nr:hypothetical protein [Actinomycetota bacterium]